jgi:seryl-tRNA synthetase
MLDVKLLRQSPEIVQQQMGKRGMNFPMAEWSRLEEERKTVQTHLQALQEERNKRSKEVGQAKAKGEACDAAMGDLKRLSDHLKSTEERFHHLAGELENLLAHLPNLPHASVPLGQGEADNQVIRQVGTPPTFSFKPKDHAALGAPHGWMDFETAAKLSGARYVVLRGPLAALQRALIQFMMDLHTQEHGYQEIYVPYIANADCFFGAGQLPKFKEDLYAVSSGEGQAQYLISTSEVTVTNTVRDQILNLSELPIRYVCYSSCFRSEAGSYGKDMQGMLRQHQFEKVELVQIVHPAQSYETLETLTRHAETVLQRLDLPYQVVALSTGDLGFASAKTYDLEVWLPGQNRYREISSCSNFEAFQARRIKARFRDEKGNIDWVHTLNGSGLAVGRALIAILENYQDELGRIHIPKALQPYLNKKVID